MDNTVNYDFAPIVLFVFNRPDCARQTLDALGKNIFAKESDLYVYADGPRREEDVPECIATREVVEEYICCFRNVYKIYQDTNLGLAKNSIKGITEVIDERGKMIMMEDDTVPAPYFLKFLNEGLSRYQDCNEVMEISGFQVPFRTNKDPRAVFLKGSFAWAWGTWKNRWDLYHRDAVDLMSKFSHKDIYHLNFDGSIDIYDQLRANRDGEIDTWAVFWAAIRYLNNGYMLCPTQSLIKVIGFDERSEHNTGTDIYYGGSVCMDDIFGFPEIILEDIKIRKLVSKFFLSKCSLKSKIALKIERYIGRR